MRWCMSYIFMFLVLCSCSKLGSHRGGQSTLRCVVPGSIQAKSIELCIIDTLYPAIYRYELPRDKAGHYVYTGDVPHTCPAFFRIPGLTEPVYFVLQAGETSLIIRDRGISVRGNSINHEYFELIRAIRTNQKQRQVLLDKYRKAFADSTLTQRLEVLLRKQDSALFVTNQNSILKACQRNDALGVIARERFIHLLTPDRAKAISITYPQIRKRD